MRPEHVAIKGSPFCAGGEIKTPAIYRDVAKR